MKTNDTHTQLLTLVSEKDPDAYKALYETATSTLLELTKSWTEDLHEKTDKQLTIWSRLSKRIGKRLNGGNYSIEYEAGRLSGIIEVFECLYRWEEDTKIIDATISELLSGSKPASKRVLRILYEASKDDEWVPNARLENECSQSRSALSNIMKRLVQANAVEYLREGRTISYRISPAGKRYYEKTHASQVENDIVSKIEDLEEKTDLLQKMLDSYLKKGEQQPNDNNTFKNIMGLRSDNYFRKLSFSNTNEDNKNLLLGEHTDISTLNYLKPYTIQEGL